MRVDKRAARYVPQFVYGAFDGIVTTFAVVAAGAGAGLDARIIVILGLANLIADGFSMGASAYLSQRTESVPHEKHPMKVGIATFSAFVVVGFLPVFPYLVGLLVPGTAEDQLFVVACVVAALAFILVGYGKAYKAGKRAAFISIAETLVLGIVAAALAYLLGDVLARLFGA
jgi:VIT1/CCC1 family predicted Fe2+/Mn2+ transporter